ncbi:MAG TPA: LuxR C-terminal-related transcriptional regulator [Ktedonobacterales bacterium]|nr:LuxR C-terminal-related transcriptional regulator [Ktedonobacterales bacterium]
MHPTELRDRRKRLRLSQADLGRALGVARNTVARWERGELDIRHPDLVILALDQLQNATSNQANSLTIRNPPNNLPAETNSFIGRQDEIGAVCKLLTGTRLVTLIGTGGVGKTRLALRVARQSLAEFPEGVWWVDLAPLSDAALIGRTIGGVLDIREDATRPTAKSLASGIGSRRLLLVLDNCEHLLEGFAGLLRVLLGNCPNLRALATSREPLRLSAENVYAVLPFPTPPPHATHSPRELLQMEAIRLLIERTAAQAGGPPDPDRAVAFAEIALRLDGLPLALELAAARLPSIGAWELSRRLTNALAVLTCGPRDATDRHSTLRAMLDWSYALLTPSEQCLLARLSVFVGGWTLEACEGVCADNGIEASNVLDLLGGLIAKSLVHTEAGPAGTIRYRMLETVRQYAAEKLDRSRELDAIRARCRDWYLDLIENAPEDGRRPLGNNQVLARLDADADNIRVALNSSLQDDRALERAIGAAGKIWWFWTDRGRPVEGWEMLQQLLARADAVCSESRAEGVYGACLLAWAIGGERLAVARELADQAVAMRRELGGVARVAHVLCGVSRPLMDVGEMETARLFLHESLELAQAADKPQTVARCLHGLGTLAHRRLDLVRAAEYYARAFKLCQQIQDRYGMTTELGTWLLLEYQRGDWRQALARARQAILLRRELRARSGQHELLGVVAGVIAGQRQPERAGRFYGASEQVRQQFGMEREVWRSAALSTLLTRDLAYARTRIGAAAFAQSVVTGRSLQLDQALDEALMAIDLALTNARDRRANGRLTPRELEVADLVARGCTNRQIADQLVVTEATAAKHVEHILNRLGFNTRSQIAAWAASQASAADEYS